METAKRFREGEWARNQEMATTLLLGIRYKDDYQDHSCIPYEQAVSIGMSDFWLLDLGSEGLAGFVTCCSI